jgi:hypothetical protein
MSTAVTVVDLNNAKLDCDHIAAIATSTAATATDRLGNTKQTIKGATDAIAAKVAGVEATKNTAINTTIPGQVAAVETTKNTALTDIAADVAFVESVATSPAQTVTDSNGIARTTVTGAIAAISTLNPRGDWVTATAYAVKDVVRVSGTWYICLQAHTSGATFAGDLAAYWKVFQGVTTADLALPTAAAGIGLPQGGTVGDAIKYVTPQMWQHLVVGGNWTDAFLAARAYCLANNVPFLIPEVTGGYTLTAGTNFAANFLQIIGIGRPLLKFVGTGPGFVLDAGAMGERRDGMLVANLLVEGGAGITDACFWRGIVRSVFSNIIAYNCTSKAFHIPFAVSNEYSNIMYSGNMYAASNTPSDAFYLTESGPGYYCADNTFINCVGEDFPGISCNIHKGSGNKFVGGTFEAAGIGLRVSEGSDRNSFDSVWFEANVSRDIEISGHTSRFNDCYFGSMPSGPNVEIVTGTGTVITGGYCRTANLQSTSRDTLFVGVGLDQNLSGTLGITGVGSYKRIGCTSVDSSLAVVAALPDIIGESSSWTPLLSQGVAVTNTTAKAQIRQTGGHCHLRAEFAVTGTGTGGSALIVSGIPTGFEARNDEVDIPCGVAYFYDASANTYNHLIVKFQARTELSFFSNGGGSLFGISPGTPLEPGDYLYLSVNYEIG